MGVLLGASMASAIDLKGAASNAAAGAASDLASGKSAKEIAEADKKAKEAMDKADAKTGGAASAIGGMLKK